MRPLPRYVLAIMAAFVAFELWIPLLAIVIRALVGPTVPTAVQAVVPLFGLAVPAVVGLALSDYLADRQGLVRPYQPKRRPHELDQDEEQEQDEMEEGVEGQDEGGEWDEQDQEQGWEEENEEPVAGGRQAEVEAGEDGGAGGGAPPANRDEALGHGKTGRRPAGPAARGDGQ